jgi:hypothetical protein
MTLYTGMSRAVRFQLAFKQTKLRPVETRGQLSKFIGVANPQLATSFPSASIAIGGMIPAQGNSFHYSVHVDGIVTHCN